MSLENILHDGIASLGLHLPSDQADAMEAKLMAYLRLLSKWNRTYNLTAIRNEAEMVTHHLLDSLSLAPYLEDVDSLADVGSGAGLPGIPLAIIRPDLKITSIETVEKKVAFQQQAKIELKLANFTAHGGRVEKTQGQFAAVTSRAFADLADFVTWSGHLVRPGGRLLAMKGVYPADEIARLPEGWRLVESKELKVHGLDAERHLLVVEKV